ncbi:hypothetical protein [Croceicoccus mobilis]|uniref:Uncharacterized protein n=1 Tax=Croceicoccus mobilis TaxID=1703339 RepID=A0A917DV51_9SPHN|nr:hypothetical protein [Croceicoccus mobilis]GGD74112.1 hypothetical protein GCM10010990_24690 [Croceicoccus mobilis]
MIAQRLDAALQTVLAHAQPARIWLTSDHYGALIREFTPDPTNVLARFCGVPVSLDNMLFSSRIIDTTGRSWPIHLTPEKAT